MTTELIPIENLISFWENSLQEHCHQMSPSIAVLTEQTIMRLKELKDKEVKISH